MFIMILGTYTSRCHLDSHSTFYKENKLLINDRQMIVKTKSNKFIFFKMKTKEYFFQETKLTKI